MQIQNWLSTLDSQKHVHIQINLSSRTTSLDLQRTIEDNIDKRTGRIFGPPSGKAMKVFIDDLNMPKVSPRTPCSRSIYPCHSYSRLSTGSLMKRFLLFGTEQLSQAGHTPHAGKQHLLRGAARVTCMSI